MYSKLWYYVAVYDLVDGHRAWLSTYENFWEALHNFSTLCRVWRDEPADDDWRPAYHIYDVMVYNWKGDIICGFGEKL